MLWNDNKCGKTKLKPRQPSQIKIMIDQKQLENVEYFKYFVKLYKMYTWN
jgi:hypothetical protein